MITSADNKHSGLQSQLPVTEITTPIKRRMDDGGNTLVATVLSQADTIKRLENRVSILEGVISRSSTAPRGASTTGGVQAVDKESQELRSSLFRGKRLKTQFYGPSRPASQFLHFSEAKAFLTDILPHSNMKRLRNEAKLISERYKASQVKLLPAEQNLRHLIPPRSVVDSFVRLYFEYIDTIYHIFHEPSFRREYNAFWDDTESDPPGFAAILLLIMVTVECISPNPRPSFSPRGSTTSDQAISWIRAYDGWFRQQSNKHRYLAIYQARILRVIAATINSFKIKELYPGAQDLSNYFKTAGYHRDPNLLSKKCSPLEREMRRRLWATVAELELDASIERGVASSLVALHMDCSAPLNIDDEDIHETFAEMPIPKPSSQFTKTSFLHISSQSLSLRRSLNSLINDPTVNMSFEEVLHYEQQIKEALYLIPQFHSEEHLQVVTLLDIQLRQFLIMLHSQFARRTWSPHNQYSRMICYNTSVHILEQHSKLIAANNFALSLSRSDIIRAAFSLCHTAFISTVIKDDIFLTTIKATFNQTIEKASLAYEERVMRCGGGSESLFYISAWCGLVEQKLTPELASSFKAQAMDKVIRLYHKFLAFQVDAGSRNHELGNASYGVDFGRSVGVTDAKMDTGDSVSASGGLRDGFEDFEGLDMSDWMMEGLWGFDMLPEF